MDFKIGFMKKILQYFIDLIMGRHIILRRFTQVFAVDVVTKLIGFILLPVYLRLMSQNEYGVFGYFLGFVNTFGSLFNLGLYVAQTKLYHDYQKQSRESLLFTLNVLLYAYIGIAFALIYIFRIDYILIKVLFSHPIHYDSYRSSFFLGILMNVMTTMLFNYFITAEKIRLIQIYNLMRIIVDNAVIILLLVTLPGDKALIRLNAYFILELVITAGMGLFYLQEMRPEFSWKQARHAMKIGLPIAAGGIISLVYNFSDRFILEKVAQFSYMAIYNLGLTIAGIIGMVFSTFHNIWLPLFFKEKDLKANYRKTNKATLVLAGMFVVLGMGLWITVALLLRFSIIRSEYNQVLILLPILMAGQIAQSVTFLYNNYMTYFEKVYIATAMSVFSSILILVFNILLIPRWKMFGAAFSLFFTAAIYFLVYFSLVRVMLYRRLNNPGTS